MPNYRLIDKTCVQAWSVVEDVEKSVKVQANSNTKNFSTAPGFWIQHGIFQCCGLTGLSGLSYMDLSSWDQKANMTQFLYNTFQKPGHIIYVLERHQLKTSAHLFMLEIGAKQMGEEFRNLNYSDHWLSIWLVNVKELKYLSKYLDEYGRTKKDPELIAAEKKAQEEANKEAVKKAAAPAQKASSPKPAPVKLEF